MRVRSDRGRRDCTDGCARAVLYGSGICPALGLDCGKGDPRRRNGPCPVVDVATGELKVVRGPSVLVSAAIGSCVAVAALEARRLMGGIAHVMLPGRSPRASTTAERLRYAEDAIDELLVRLAHTGAHFGHLDICLAGGGNVLRRSDDTICAANIASVRAAIDRRGLRPRAESLGGFVRRRLRVDVSRGCVFCGEGDGPERLLWQVVGRDTVPTKTQRAVSPPA